MKVHCTRARKLRAISNLITLAACSSTSAPHEAGMYRIELSPGEETVFRSIEELAVAIKRNVVTPKARIYHNASGKWLPIQFHPHYKAAVSMPLTPAALVAGPPVKQLDSLSLETPEEPESPIMAAPVPLPAAPAQKDASTTPKKTRAAQPAASKRGRRPAKPRRQLRIALVGALLIGGAQWVLSAPLFSRTDAPALIRSQRHLITAPIEAMKQASSPNTAAMVPVLPNSTSAATPTANPTSPGVARAPSFGGIGVIVKDSLPHIESDSIRNPALPATIRSESLGPPPPAPR
jgi:hypothetical protein